jgi:hypothetical protein
MPSRGLRGEGRGGEKGEQDRGQVTTGHGVTALRRRLFDGSETRAFDGSETEAFDGSETKKSTETKK